MKGKQIISSFCKRKLLSAVLLLTIGVFLAASGCSRTPADGGSVKPAGSNPDSADLKDLWINSKYFSIEELLLERRSSGTLLNAEENFYLGFSSYIINQQNKDPVRLSQAVSAFERYKLLIGESSDRLATAQVNQLLALAYFKLGEFSRSITAAEQAGAVQQQGIDTEGLTALTALARYRSKNYTAAYNLLSEIGDSGFALSLLLFESAVLSGEAGETTETPEKHLLAAAESADSEADRFTALSMLANYYAETGSYAKARETLAGMQKTFSSKYLLSSVFFTMGTLHLAEGNLIESRTMMNRSLELNPKNRFALEKLSK
ncbi:MAG: hypothetical protein K9L21_03565 [Spirochaetia bacterium]|nr:hypothetical protein [Spirochaetia bacterium]